MGARRRPNGRRMAARRPGKYAGMKLYKETLAAAPITIDNVGGAVGPNPFKFQAKFSDITNTVPPGATVGTRDSFRSLYSRYCIVGVKYRFIPLFTSSDSSTNPSARVVHAISRDPNGVSLTELDVVRQNDCKFTDTTKGFSVYIKNPEPILYSTAGSTAGTLPNQVTPGIANQVAASPSTKKWTWLPTRIDTANGGVHLSHVGLDMVITPSTLLANPTQVYNVFATIYVAFKEQD